MPVWVLVIFVVMFAIVSFALAIGLRFMEEHRRKQVSGMLRTVNASSGSIAKPTLVLRDDADGTLDTIAKALPVALKLERLIKQAGMDWSVPKLLLFMIGGAVAGVLIGLYVRVLIDVYLSAIALMLVLGAAPLLIVTRKRAQRLKDFESQLPDALDFMARSMRAGHAFSVALEMLAEESPEPLAFEFRQVYNEQNLGSSIDAALKGLHTRVPAVDVGFFVSAVLLQKQTGGNLAEILTKLAYIIRERFRLKGKVRAASAHGRLTGIILTIMPFMLMLALSFLVPDYLPSMVQDSIGKYLVAAAVVSQLIGYLFIRKIINIKV
jgi:tight adherence protein B